MAKKIQKPPTFGSFWLEKSRVTLPEKFSKSKQPQNPQIYNFVNKNIKVKNKNKMSCSELQEEEIEALE